VLPGVCHTLSVISPIMDEQPFKAASTDAFAARFDFPKFVELVYWRKSEEERARMCSDWAKHRLGLGLGLGLG
jgi:hypothetical protein